jgi:parallel beta-helix repeat protein
MLKNSTADDEKTEVKKSKKATRFIASIAIVAIFFVGSIGVMSPAGNVNKECVGDETTGYVNAMVEQIKHMIDTEIYLTILDVRTQTEYESGHIDGAVLIPYTELELRINELDCDKNIIIYCGSGVRGAIASQTLAEHGFQVYNMVGGLAAWGGAGYPVVFALTHQDNPIKEEITTEELAKRLTAQGWVMYGTDRCPWCIKQKNDFSDLFKHINYINCNKNAQACRDAGIKTIPTWVSPGGTHHPGYNYLNKLAKLVGAERVIASEQVDTIVETPKKEGLGCGHAGYHPCDGEIGCVGEHYTFTCGMVVNESCTLNGNMKCSDNTTDGLIIGVHNITIDGAGYKIVGNKSYDTCYYTGGESNPADHCGIRNNGNYDNVVIKNLEIENFCTGIALGSGSSSDINANTITGCTIHDNGIGYYIEYEDEFVTHGIHLVATNNCTITENDIYNNLGTGTGCGDGGNGIFMYAGSKSRGNYNNITYNSIYDNNKSGFFMKMRPMFNSISHNNITGNGEYGITPMCMLSDDNTFESNYVAENSGGGIYMGGNRNKIRYNTVINNGNYGINMGRSDGSSDNELHENKVCGHGRYDIHVSSEATGNHGDKSWRQQHLQQLL